MIPRKKFNPKKRTRKSRLSSKLVVMLGPTDDEP